MKISQKPQYTLGDGTVAVFSTTKFKSALLRKKSEMEQSGCKCSQQEILENIASDIGISLSALKHWSAGHNAPSDLYKVSDLAVALNVETNYLLETEMEESVDMTNTKTTDKIIHTTDYSTTKSVIRSIYGSMSDHIEMFRFVSAFEPSTNPLNLNFTKLYSELMAIRFDIPKTLFDKLVDFATNFLQQMGCYCDFLNYIETEGIEFGNSYESSDFELTYINTYTCAPCAPWCKQLYVYIDEKNEFCMRFWKALVWQHNVDIGEGIIPSGKNEVIAYRAYECLEEILGEYR